MLVTATHFTFIINMSIINHAKKCRKTKLPLPTYPWRKRYNKAKSCFTRNIVHSAHNACILAAHQKNHEQPFRSTGFILQALNDYYYPVKNLKNQCGILPHVTKRHTDMTPHKHQVRQFVAFSKLKQRDKITISFQY